MVNKLKKLERERTRLRKSQNPQVIDERRARKLTKTRVEYWKQKQKSGRATKVVLEEEKKKPTKKKAREKKQEPELEEISETSKDDFDDLYTYDEDIEEEDA